MKKTQEVIGLPIISISDGIEVGKVKNVIINADKGAIDYIVVDSGIQILSAKIIPTDSILGIGEYALTIENDSAINDISKIPAAIDLLQKNIQVKGTKVLTKKGRLIGEIGDIYIDEDECCKIVGLEYIADITQKRIRLIPRDSVITFGKNLVVVKDDVENALVDRSNELSSGEKAPEAEKKNLVNSDTDDDNYSGTPQEEIFEDFSKSDITDDSYFKSIEILPVQEPVQVLETVPETSDSFQTSDMQELVLENPGMDISISEEAIDLKNTEFNVSELDVKEEAPVSGGTFPGNLDNEEPDKSPSAASQESNAASLFEQRQRQYLNGRRITKTITDNLGNVIISEGMVITHEVIDAAKESGKLIELVMNNKA